MTPKQTDQPKPDTLQPMLELLEREKEITEQAFETRVEIGEQLRAARVAKGLSQPQLQRLSGVRQAEISQLERGIIWRPNDARKLVAALAAYVPESLSAAS